MSAQYRPYRDEESVDGLETTSWTDNEPGTIQIYEKTTEELPFGATSKKAFWTRIALFFLTGLLGFLLGYFGPFHQRDILSSLEDGERLTLEHHEFIEDSTIKDKLLSQIDGNNILNLLKQYNDTNRIPGSNDDHRLAFNIEKLFNEYGFDSISTNHSFYTMLPQKPSVVQLLDKGGKVLYSNIDQEHYPHDDMRPFLPLSQANQTSITTNQILYINRGLKEDYSRLPSLGEGTHEIDGKVLVIRQSFYQAYDVVIAAQESGAKAVLLFPDPEIYGSSSPFPKPVQLPDDAARSHPTAWSNYGDLAAFNLTSLNSMEAKFTERETKILIPVIPISLNTARKILRGLTGPQAPSDWNCFDFTLYVGPGYRDENNIDQRDKLKIDFFNEPTLVTTSTVTGIIAGATEPDRYIIIGSRRDSLNRGLLDSLSGTAIMLELARVYGALVKQGWRPRRTIIFNSFGAETLNLIASSYWLEAHQRVLHSRAVAYLNCDLVVIGNKTASITASPLLYQTLYNATKQVINPNLIENPQLQSVYEAWKNVHHVTKARESKTNNLTDPDLEKILDEYEAEPKLTRASSANSDSDDDNSGYPGSILREYRKSATIKTRPKVRRLDLHSIYSPFFLYAGIPVVDVKYAGFTSSHQNTNFLEDTLPAIGTKYDNLATIQLVDPHLKYHIAVAQVLSEILRDLSDSIFLPYNLLDYAVTLKDSYSSFVAQHGKTVSQSNIDLDILKQAIQEFTKTAMRFHHHQDTASLKDPLQIRKLNDQLMLLERAFLDSAGTPNHWERKHIILSPNEGSDHKGGFPGLSDWITLLDGLDPVDLPIFAEVLKLHYKAVVHTITNAMRMIDEVHIL